MWKHLSDEQLMTVLDGLGSPKEDAHAAECARCQGLLQDARASLGALEGGAALPEPAGLYWESFRRQVASGLEAERPSPWLRLHWAPALAAAAVLVAAVGLFQLPLRHATLASPSVPVLEPWNALPPAEEDSGLALIQAMVPSPDELAPAAGCETVTSCVVDRASEEESHAFLERMRSERGGLL